MFQLVCRILNGAVCRLAWAAIVASVWASTAEAQSSSVVSFVKSTEASGPVITTLDYRLKVVGEMVTPSTSGAQKWPLTSEGEFRFVQHQFPGELIGPRSLQATRQFESAMTQTSVSDTKTSVTLPIAYRPIHVYGSNDGLIMVHPEFALPRKQLDLLQMPCDVLPVTALLPSGSASVGDKWNVDAWALLMLTGIEAATAQSATCELKSANETTATIAFSGTVNGAVQGSASEVEVSGELQFDRTQYLITSLTATQKEKRTAGPVSPGLNVTAAIQWTQAVAEPPTDQESPDLPKELPSEKSKLLALQTPLKLQMLHSREWHLFHETPTVIMLRQLRSGNLISQCNISSAVTVPPKQHTPDEEFLQDVITAVKERKGRVATEATVRDDQSWRIRHVQAIGDADGKDITWDYYLCAAATGEQFSIVFSHSNDDSAEFGDEARKILATLQVARRRPALPR